MNKLLLVLWSVSLVALLYGGGSKAQEAQVQSLQGEINTLKSEVNQLKSHVSEVRNDVSDLKSHRDNLRSTLDDLTNKISNAPQKSDIDHVHSEVETVASDLRRLEQDEIAALKRTDETVLSRLSKSGLDRSELHKAISEIQEAQTLHASRLEQLKTRTRLLVWHP